MKPDLAKIREAIEDVIEDDHDDGLALAAVIVDRVVGPLHAERDALKAAIERQRAALATFDGRGVNNFDVPTPGEVLAAWRAALDTPSAPESPREDHVDSHGRSWDRHPFVKSSRVGDNVAVCVCGQSPEHKIHTPESPESEETT